MDLELEGRVILVVGGHGLIGRAVVQRLRTEGAVAIPASRHAPHGVVVDASSDQSVSRGLAAVEAEHGPLDGLVVTAAPSARTLDPTRNADPAQVLRAVDEKAMTFLRTANFALPGMVARGFGRVIGVSGQNAFMTGNIAGSVRNAALIVAAKNLADSTAGTGVTVNSVSPSMVSESPPSEVENGLSGGCRPSDVADLIAFLLSPRAGAVSGESIAVGHRVRGVTYL
jgi:NAD(P)-dependent dehydrogenase (short-subunit alcohol dehydrogenase family)